MKTPKEMLDLKDRALTLAARAISNYDGCVNCCPVAGPCGYSLQRDSAESYCVPRIIAAFEQEARGES